VFLLRIYIRLNGALGEIRFYMEEDTKLPIRSSVEQSAEVSRIIRIARYSDKTCADYAESTLCNPRFHLISLRQFAERTVTFTTLIAQPTKERKAHFRSSRRILTRVFIVSTGDCLNVPTVDFGGLYIRPPGSPTAPPLDPFKSYPIGLLFIV